MCYTGGPRCSNHAKTKLSETAVEMRTKQEAVDATTADLERAEAAVQALPADSGAMATIRVRGAHGKATKAHLAARKELEQAETEHRQAKTEYALTPEGINEVRAMGHTEKADQLEAKRKQLVAAAKKRQAAKAEPEASEPADKTKPVLDYKRLHHLAPGPGEGNAPIHDLTGVYGNDYIENPHHYTARPHDRELLSQVKKARGNPNAMLTIYRALPKQHSEINEGDWVALSKDYAQTHLTSISKDPNAGEWHIIAHKVPAHTLWSEGNDLTEWGYNGEALNASAV